ncbi:hypothetical protein TSUD_104540 [Trifolium subterraneum]|uniref:non-specific serine/threonine protein kinase n=1 Tax=Trifolium subterraneum TaxID=3900 RepID=A0A2Z6MTV2_TRISU|nr:hypothetical protein TSUD_104540 [Trifolium subterraneum]
MVINGALSGNYLGLFNRSSSGDDSNHVFAVEFDDFRNEEFDEVNDNHVGVDLNSMVSLYSEPAEFWGGKNGEDLEKLKLSSGENYQVWIEFRDFEINVTMAPAGKRKPKKPLISKPINFSRVFLDEMYVGFSGSTGKMVDTSRILAWSFSHTNFSIGDALNTKHLPKKEEKEGEYEDWELEYWPHKISYKEICDGTGGFCEENVIGIGTSGKVYKGVLKGGEEVAVKRFNHDTQHGIRGFLAEISSLGRMKHRNLLGFKGWSKGKGGKLILVYDYMENESLDKRIFECEETKLLNWEQRIRVLENVASGVLYLHEGWEFEVLHRDIKASNVLLDKDMNARIGELSNAIDERLKGQIECKYNTVVAERLLHLGLLCASFDPCVRPTMRQVVKALEGVKCTECNEECVHVSLIGKINSAASWSKSSTDSARVNFPTLDDILPYKYFSGDSLSVSCFSLEPISDSLSEGRSSLRPDMLSHKGRAFYPQRVPTKSPNSSAILPFATSFIFSVAPIKNIITGHGFAFIFTPSRGLNGTTSNEYIGLFNFTNEGNPNNHVFGIEFDIIRNEEFNDTNGNHVGIDVNSLKSLTSHEAGYWGGKYDNEFKALNIKSGENYQVWIEFMHSKINVTMVPAGQKKPQVPLISVDVNLSGVLVDETYVGFCAATGKIVDSSKILAWSFSNTNFSIGDALVTENLPSFVPHKGWFSGVKAIAVGVTGVVCVLIIGYIAPEVIRTGRASTMSDVFGFGILLLEVICGRRPIEEHKPGLTEWVKSLMVLGELHNAVDERLKAKGGYPIEEAERLLHLGLLCSNSDPSVRPIMRQIVKMLEGEMDSIESDEGNMEKSLLGKIKSTAMWSRTESGYNDHPTFEEIMMLIDNSKTSTSGSTAIQASDSDLIWEGR